MKTQTFNDQLPIIDPVRLFTIIRSDGTEYRIAESQTQIVTASSPDVPWLPIGLTRLSSVRRTIGGQVPSCVLTAALNTNGPFKPIDVDAGKFKNAKFVLYLSAKNQPVLAHDFTGYIGRHTFGYPQTVSFEIRGRLAKGKGSMMSHFQVMCRTDLGSALCKVPIKPADGARLTTYAVGDFRRFRTLSPTTGTPQDYENRYYEVTAVGSPAATGAAQPSFDTTVGNTTVDGGVTWTARDAWLRWGQISSITDNGHGIVLTGLPDPRAFSSPASTWFAHGYIYFITGYSATEAEPIAKWDQTTNKVTLYRDMTDLVAAGDYVELHRGCDFRKVTCADVFANASNFRGEDDFLGSDVASAVLAPTVPVNTGGGSTTGTVINPGYPIYDPNGSVVTTL